MQYFLLEFVGKRSHKNIYHVREDMYILLLLEVSILYLITDTNNYFLYAGIVGPISRVYECPCLWLDSRKLSECYVSTTTQHRR